MYVREEHMLHNSRMGQKAKTVVSPVCSYFNTWLSEEASLIKWQLKRVKDGWPSGNSIPDSHSHHCKCPEATGSKHLGCYWEYSALTGCYCKKKEVGDSFGSISCRCYRPCTGLRVLGLKEREAMREFWAEAGMTWHALKDSPRPVHRETIIVTHGKGESHWTWSMVWGRKWGRSQPR